MLKTKKYNNEAASYPYVSAIIVAAGNSTRMGGVNKQFLLIDGVPVLIRTLKAFENSELIKEIIISAREEDIPQMYAMLKDYCIKKVSNIVKGGCTRQESVFNAVKCCVTESDYIAIHDGARPLVSTETIEETIFAAFNFEAAAPGIPVKDTIKVVDGDGIVVSTPARDSLRAIQTPQVFNKEMYLSAMQSVPNSELFTDDCGLIEAFGKPVEIVGGDNTNIKITTPEDLVIAEAIISKGENDEF